MRWRLRHCTMSFKEKLISSSTRGSGCHWGMRRREKIPDDRREGCWVGVPW